jgi:hypothetical protein
MYDTNCNDLIMQFFKFSAIFQENMILPKISLKPQRSECKQSSSCSIFHKLSENHSIENFPPGGRGYWWLEDYYPGKNRSSTSPFVS